MRKITSVAIALLATLLALPSLAQDMSFRRGNCLPEGEVDADVAASHGNAVRRLPSVNKNWDAGRVYHQLVILVSFSDTDFKEEDPQTFYDRMLNEEGYNQRLGPGCLAEYFRMQSGGLFNVQFDVYGPYKVESKAQPYDAPTEKTRNYGRNQMIAATNMFLEEHSDIDFSQYDWNNNGKLNQVIYICAGFTGNQNNEKCYGYIWPNTSTFTAISTPDGKKISDYSCSNELWANGTSCGFGTIAHEYTHSLGLPDIYPTSSSGGYSVVDEWDLMDGGNFTNYGWCPPNYTPLEKMLLGWLTPIELDEPTTISNLKTVADGGEVYMVKNTINEYYLLENRQWSGWDIGVPGKGLVIYHVNYNASNWSGNTVNNKQNAHNFHLIAADNRDYDSWDDFLTDSGASTQYANSGHMNNLHMSGAPYPLTDDEGTLNNALTDTSVPAAVVYNENADSALLMSKPITDIVQNEDGTVSFKFMNGMLDVIDNLIYGLPPKGEGSVFDLQGRRIYGKPARGLVIKDKRKMIIR